MGFLAKVGSSALGCWDRQEMISGESLASGAGEGCGSSQQCWPLPFEALTASPPSRPVSACAVGDP